MYRFYCDDTLFFLNGIDDNEYQLISAKLSFEKGKVGALTFTLPHTNIIYDQIQKLKSIITVYDNDEEIFRGRVLYDEKDFYNRKTITCEGELAFLLDSVQRPYSHKGSLNDFLYYLVNEHNKQVEKDKQFTLGNITVIDNNDYLSRSSSDYDNTYNVIKDKLIGSYGGYLKTRKEEGIRYIDYLEEYGDINDQVIEFGTNILDFKEYVTAENIFTCLIPLGAKDEETGERLTIKEVNANVDCLTNQTAIDLFGRIWAYEIWDDVTVASNLMRKAQAHLEANIELAVTLTLKAVDLHVLNVETSRIKEGDKLRVISLPHGIDKFFECTKVDIDPLDPSNNEYTFGSTYKTLTDPSTGIDNATAIYIKEAVSQGSEDIKQEIAEVEKKLTQEELFNIITDNGKAQGIYLVDGQIWINGTYINVDELSALTANLGDVTAGTINGEYFEINLNSGTFTLGERDESGTFTNIWFRADENGITQTFTGEIKKEDLEEIQKNVDDLADSTAQRFEETNTQLNDSIASVTASYTSMISQTKSEIEQSVQSLTESVTGNTDTITRLESSLNLTDEQLSYIRETTQILEDVVNGKIDEETLREWARFDGARLELGVSNSEFKTILSNTELGFYQGDEKVAWISNQELNVLRAIISQSIGVGKLRLVDETETLGVYSFLVI